MHENGAVKLKISNILNKSRRQKGLIMLDFMDSSKDKEFKYEEDTPTDTEQQGTNQDASDESPGVYMGPAEEGEINEEKE